MILAARCPECGTAFRIVPDQLKISEGWVRCGQCHYVFDAYKTQYQTSKDSLGQEPAQNHQHAAPTTPSPASPTSFTDEIQAEMQAADAPITKDSQNFEGTPFSDTLLSEFHIGWADTIIQGIEKEEPSEDPHLNDVPQTAKQPQGIPAVEKNTTGADDFTLYNLPYEHSSILSTEEHKKVLESIPKTFEELQSRQVQKESQKEAAQNLSATAEITSLPAATSHAVKENTDTTVTHIDLLNNDALDIEQNQQTLENEHKVYDEDELDFTKSMISFNDSLLNSQFFDNTLDEDEVAIKAKIESAPTQTPPLTPPHVHDTQPTSTSGEEYKTPLNDIDYEKVVFIPTHIESTLPNDDEDFSATTSHEALETVAPSLHEQELSGLSFIKKNQGNSIWEKSVIKVSSACLCLIFVLALALQISLTFRNQLATQYSSLRPLLTSLCSYLSCTVGYPIDLNAITIDAASFEITTDNRYKLELTIRNRGTQTIAIPWVELTLNNASGVTIVRKAFSPEELGITKAALKPREELFINQNIMVNAQDIIGKNYSVILFYL